MANTGSSATAGNPGTTGASGTSAGADVNMQTISSDVAELKRELSRLSALVGDIAEKRYGQFRAQAMDTAQDYVDRGMALKDEAYERATAMEREVEKTIRERPIVAVAIAAGMGYLIGLVSRSGR